MSLLHDRQPVASPPAACWWSTTTARPASRWPTCCARPGHQVACCSSAAEALQVARAARRFDCIVTDLKMPGMNGLEFIVQLEQRRYGAQVVMVTAHATVASAVEAMRHGAFDYIEKPFDADQL